MKLVICAGKPSRFGQSRQSTRAWAIPAQIDIGIHMEVFCTWSTYVHVSCLSMSYSRTIFPRNHRPGVVPSTKLEGTRQDHTQWQETPKE
jgi:hypothetical protein